MNKKLLFTGLGVVLITLLFSCKTESDVAWEAFKACNTDTCVKEVVAVKDAFVKDTKSMMVKFDEVFQNKENYYTRWFSILRDSVLLNSNYAPAGERTAVQEQIVAAAKQYENDPKYGDLAESLIRETEALAITSEPEDVPEVYTPINGTYFFELWNEKGSGELKAMLESDEKLKFELSVVGGPPAFNQGMMEGIAVQTAPNLFEYSTTEFGSTCELRFTFEGEAVEIKTLEGGPAACGFGNGVTPDNVYRIKSLENPFAPVAGDNTAQNLQGVWISTIDNNSVVRIENGLYTEIYDGEQLDQNPYKYHQKCPKDCDPLAEMPCFSVTGNEVICYEVILADGKSLEISMIGGRGNTLVFKRK